MICLTVMLGISYAQFSAVIEENDNAKKQYVQTGNLRLTYTDTSTISIDNAFPGDTYEKTVSVKNTGTANANYSLVWQELTNNIINNELVIEGTCKRLNSDGAGFLNMGYNGHYYANIATTAIGVSPAFRIG